MYGCYATVFWTVWNDYFCKGSFQSYAARL